MVSLECTLYTSCIAEVLHVNVFCYINISSSPYNLFSIFFLLPVLNTCSIWDLRCSSNLFCSNDIIRRNMIDNIDLPNVKFITTWTENNDIIMKEQNGHWKIGILISAVKSTAPYARVAIFQYFFKMILLMSKPI
jgi:hypothetical protein